MHKINSHAVEAMRRWYRLGKPGVVESAELAGSGKISPADLLEMAACAESMDKLRRENPEIIDVLQGVYMAGSTRGALKKGEISTRVLHYSTQNYISEREVWRLLTQATRTLNAYLTLTGEGERKKFD